MLARLRQFAKVMGMKTPLFLLALTLPLPCLGQDAISAAIVSLETGVICAPETIGTSPAPDTVAGVTNVIEDEPEFVSTLNRVPAVIGVGFGAKAQSADPFGLAGVTITVRHPAMGPQKVTVQSYDSFISGADNSLTFYQFDFDYELLVGRWTIEARQDGNLLYRSRFDVVPPEQIPELAGVCGFLELLS